MPGLVDQSRPNLFSRWKSYHTAQSLHGTDENPCDFFLLGGLKPKPKKEDLNNERAAKEGSGVT
jgi:hypothetical protein